MGGHLTVTVSTRRGLLQGSDQVVTAQLTDSQKIGLETKLNQIEPLNFITSYQVQIGYLAAYLPIIMAEGINTL